MLPFQKRVIVLRAEEQRERLLTLARNLPINAEHPIQVVFDVYRAPRNNAQNALLWSGPLRDMAEQATLEGKRYSAEVWMEYFKRELLPEDFDPELCRDGYRKWDILPNDERVMVGSSTQLTVKGFSQFLEQIYAFGSELGVQFTASPKEGKS